MKDLDIRLLQELALLKEQGLHRQLRVPSQDAIDFSSNDYLGLRDHPALIEAAIEWTRRYGAGSGASRLAGGNIQAYLEVEEKLAHFKSKEAALIFNSGFQLNATMIPLLCDLLKPALFADKLIHASLHHGIKASGLKQHRFRHNDLEHLRELLEKEQSGSKIILTESVFSMDGDQAPLPELCELAMKYNALLYVDEAHATGVLGIKGAGLAQGLPGEILVVGTLGKALGGFGAYLAGSRAWIDYAINRAAGFIYSTALPPSCYGVLDKALDLVPPMETERKRLKRSGEKIRATLQEKGIGYGSSTTHIIPAYFGAAEKALRAQDYFGNAGFHVPAIRPPTVPPNSSRLRISLSARHDDSAIEKLNKAIQAL